MRLAWLSLLLPVALAAPAPVTIGAPQPETTQPSSVLKNTTRTITAKFEPYGELIKVTGTVQDGLGVFLGIPFAEPRDLRFRRPLPASPSTLGGHIDGTRRPPACLQQRGSVAANVSGISEDCLLVNVITPVKAIRGGLKDLPVLVWIYGGGFYGGSALLYTSPSLASHALQSDRPVVLVTLGYRVGIWGFGHGREMTENNATNLGLHDQILALNWVKQNIDAFGGDPEKVTVFGESAGFMSANILMLNQTQDLFRGAIMQSGSASSLPGYGDSSLYQQPYDELVQYAGCNGTDSFECLRALPAEDLLAAQVNMTNSQVAYTWGYPFGPAIDGVLIPASPHQLIANGSISNVPFITGCNRDEGTEFLFPTIEGISEWPLPKAVEIMYPAPLPEGFYEGVEKFYPRDGSGCPFGSGKDLFNGTVSPAWKQVTAIFTDLLMQSRRRWLLRSANEHNHTSTWSYEFVANNPTDPAYWGSTHEAEKPYVFGRAVPELSYSPAQVGLGKQMMDYWINFAYCLEPNGECCRRSGHGREHGSNGGSYDDNGHGHGRSGGDHDDNGHGRGRDGGGHDDNGHDKRGGDGNNGKQGENGKQGGYGGGDLPHWPAHSWPDNKNSLQLDAGSISVIQDDFREEAIAFFNAPENAYFARRAVD